MNKANYYRIYSQNNNINHDYLLKGKDVYLQNKEIKKVFKNTVDNGRIQIEPKKIGMVSELDGAHDDYSEEEIDAISNISIPHEFNSLGGNFFLISGDLLSTLEATGINAFKAYPVTLFHEYTNRTWNNYWYITFTYFQYIPLVTGKELCFHDADLFGVYFAESVIDFIQEKQIKNLMFEKFEFSLCQSVPMASINHVSDEILKDIEQLFIKHRKAPDAYWSISFFLPKLMERYSDISIGVIIEIVNADKSQTFKIKDNTASKKEFISVRESSSLYETLVNNKRNRKKK